MLAITALTQQLQQTFTYPVVKQIKLVLLCALHIAFMPSSVVSPAPIFYFGNTDYHVDESDGYVEVQVWRTGTDLSKGGTVTVRSRKTDPVSAEGTCLCEVPFYDSFS